jgi:hypothetical protein
MIAFLHSRSTSTPSGFLGKLVGLEKRLDTCARLVLSFPRLELTPPRCRRPAFLWGQAKIRGRYPKARCATAGYSSQTLIFAGAPSRVFPARTESAGLRGQVPRADQDDCLILSSARGELSIARAEQEDRHRARRSVSRPWITELSSQVIFRGTDTRL